MPFSLYRDLDNGTLVTNMAKGFPASWPEIDVTKGYEAADFHPFLVLGLPDSLRLLVWHNPDHGFIINFNGQFPVELFTTDLMAVLEFARQTQWNWA